MEKQSIPGQMDAPEISEASALTRLLPSWKGNLILFGLLILATLGYFFWQTGKAQKLFHDHVGEHTRMLAGIIRLNIDRAVLSHEVVEEIMATYLGNTAGFVDYLDAVQPFYENELTAFAQEAGLSGISIYRAGGEISEGPPGWAGDSASFREGSANILTHLPDAHLYTLQIASVSGAGRILVGIETGRIESLHEQVALPYFLKALSDVSGIGFARIEQGLRPPSGEASDPFEIELAGQGDEKVAIARIAMGDDILAVGFETTPFVLRVEQLRNEFFLFAAILASLGGFFSWLLYKYQTAYIIKVREFDGRIAREHEDASLGRAAASIAHEIRNPLNAIGIGLQRLRMEADGLDPEHRELVATLLSAVKRTNGIVSDLKRYASPFKPRSQKVFLKDIFDRVLKLYENQCNEKKIEIVREENCRRPISADADLMEEVVENLVKNALEAQPDGGYLKIECVEKNADCVWSLENKGFDLPLSELNRIFDPYFTGKTRGTGLGLAVSKRIVEAHKGKLMAHADENGVFKIGMRLPLSQSDKDELEPK